MMKTINKSMFLFVTLFFSGYLNAATITWNSTSNTVNDIFSLDVIGLSFPSNGSGNVADGGGVNLSFDPSVLNVLSVTIDELVWDFGVTGISTGTIDNVAGTVNGIMVNASSNVTGDFTVASIQFQAVGAGLSSTGITLSEYALNPWALDGSAINPTFVNGNVTVVPVPAAVWLFGSGLLCIVGVARRKKTV